MFAEVIQLFIGVSQFPSSGGGGVPNGRGGREHKALKIRLYSTAHIATTSPFGYSSSPEEEN